MIMSILKELENTTSTNAKIDILKKHSSNELFKKILYYIYTPYKNYYVKKLSLSGFASVEPTEFDDRLFELLDKLSSREFTGNNALSVISSTLANYDWNVHDIFERILSRDARCGVSTALINKAISNLIPVIPYQRCSEYNDTKVLKILDKNKSIIVQKKEDGSFWYLDLLNQKFISRSGNSFDSKDFSQITSDVILVGEMLVTDENNNILSREIGNGIINSIYQENSIKSCPPQYKLKYVYWDVLTQEEFNNLESKVIYEERMKRFTQQGNNIQFIESEYVSSMDEINDVYIKYISKKEEGIVIKSSHSLWKNGTAKDIFKRKRFVDVDLRVVSFNEGTGKYAGKLGSINFTSADGLLEVSVSGFTDEQRDEIWKNKDNYLNTIWTVKANSLLSKNKKHSLFLPVIIEQRFDKTEADTLDKIKEIFNG